jgi:pimeloyl-ACP methyl ester carboxylesterase
MKSNQIIHKSRFLHLSTVVFITIITALLFNSCKKNNDTTEPPKTNNYLIDYQQTGFYAISTIKGLISGMATSYPDINGLSESTNYSVIVYKINYKTQFKDSTITASGLVCLPVSSEAFPVISFQNGTNTLKSNAPSMNPTNSLYLLLELMAGNGYVILIPDYIGFGASADIMHPYYDRTSTDNAVIDMIKASYELLDEATVSAKSNGHQYLMGYSQGGWATLSALDKIESGSDTTITVKATSCGAGAYDMMSVSDYIFQQVTFPGPLYLPYFIYSQQKLGTISDPLTKYFKEPYAGRIPNLFDGLYSNAEVDAQLTDTIASLVTDNLRNNLDAGADFSVLRNLLTENSLTAWKPHSLINFYHGTADLNVPPSQSDNIYAAFQNLGVSSSQVKLYKLDGLNHETGIVPWGIMTIAWFNSLEKE